MPTNISDLYGDPSDQIASLYDNQAQPDTSEADAVRTKGPSRRAAAAFTQAVNPFPGMARIGHDIAAPFTAPFKDKPEAALNSLEDVGEMSKDLMGAHHIKAAMDAVHRGDWLGALQSSLQANPVGNYVGRVASGVGEKIGEGDVAGAVGQVGGEAANIGLGMGHGDVLAEPAAGPMRGFARYNYRTLTKPRKWFGDLPYGQQRSILDKAVDNFIPPTEAGGNKAGAMVDDLTEQINSPIDANPDLRVPFDKLDEHTQYRDNPDYKNLSQPQNKRAFKSQTENLQQIKFDKATPDEVEAAKQKIADERNAWAMLKWQPNTPMPPTITPDMISNAEVKAIQYPSTVTVKDLMDLKRKWRQEATTPTGILARNSVNDALSTEWANKANEILIDQFPELKQLGINDRDWINVRKLVKESSALAAKRNMGGLSSAIAPTAIAAEGMKALPVMGKAGIISYIMKDPQIRTALSTAVFKASKGISGIASTLGRLSAISAELDAQEENDQRDNAAINAKE